MSRAVMREWGGGTRLSSAVGWEAVRPWAAGGMDEPGASWLSAPAPALRDDSAIATEIRREQVSYLRRGSALSFLLQPLAAVLVFAAMLGHVPQEVVGCWVLGIWATAAMRAVLWHRYDAMRGTANFKLWAVLFGAVAAGSNLLWGGTPLLLWPEGFLVPKLLLIVTIAAVATIDMVTLASFLAAALGALAAALLGLFLALIWQGLLAWLTAGAVLFYATALAISARYVNRLLLESLRLRFELTAATAAAQSASRAKSEFIANMSHELRTPLNAIIGFSEIMKDQALGKLTPPRYADYAHDIHRSGTHLLEIINDILDLSKIEAGRFELAEEHVDLGEVVRTSMALIVERADQAGLALAADVPDPPPVIWGDERAIKQALLNLLSNAVKFTPVGGRVSVVVRRDPQGGVLLRVRDTGIGMSPSDIPKAMEPFGQLEHVHTRKRAGTGLGLPITRSLVEMHGGQLCLVSAPGAGTSAEILLPARRVVSG